MGKFVLIQAFYCICGILFFVRDLFANVPMSQGMLNAFIWPYAQWPYIREAGLRMAEPVLRLLQ